MLEPEVIVQTVADGTGLDPTEVGIGLFVANVIDHNLPLTDTGKAVAFGFGVVLARMARDWLNGARK